MAGAVAGPGDLIAERYRVVRELGRGGMAVAYEVFDLAKGETLALKQLLRRSQRAGSDLSLLFEQEYHTLSQLAHPCVVEVKNFDRDRSGRPFYTMELLEGKTLKDEAPLPPERVCALMNDLCSALSLLHSRRLVHRDLTPRNVYSLPDGRIKLIDFGAVVPFGPTRRIVGTPPYCSPELVARQELDGRSDLFALGATAYYALTGHNAYRARSFNELFDAWRSPPRAPSQLAKGVPKALDELVMSLLQLDRAARPSSAAEVMERACAICGLDPSEQLIVPQAYLSTPRLVERDEALTRVRKLLVRSVRGRGGRLLVSGEPGMGRSRFISACALEGKLIGSVVLALDAMDARGGAFSAARALVVQLFEALPGLAAELSAEQRELFTQVWPEVLSAGYTDERLAAASAPDLSAEQLASLRPRLQVALQELVLAASRLRPLLLAIDDFHQFDEPSAALFSLLANAAPAHRLAVLASAEQGALAEAGSAVSMLARAAGLIKLRRLSEQGTSELLASIFGHVPNLSLLADRLHRISGGAPGALMELAQHLLKRGVLRYEAGAFSLPGELRDDDLPASFGEALELKLDALPQTALRLAQALALAQGLRVSLEELRELAAEEERSLLMAIDRLVEHDIVDVGSGVYGLRSRSLARPLLARLSAEEKRALHLKLANLLARRDPLAQPVIQHLFEAGELDRALDLTIERHHGVEKRPISEIAAAARDLGPGWEARFRALAEHCVATGRSLRDRMLVLSSLIGYSALIGGDTFEDFDHLQALLDQAAHDAGLDLYEELRDLPEGERLKRALERAQLRYEQTKESERVWPPAEAIRVLARSVVQSIGLIGGRHEPALYDSVPSLAPLVALSPALWVIHENFLGAIHLATGQMHRARERLAPVLERMGEPGSVAGEDAHLAYMRLAIRFAMCSTAVSFGQEPPEHYLASLEQDAFFEVNAARLRMVLALRRGDFKTADEQRHRAEVLRVQNSPPQMFDGAHLNTEYLSYVFHGDLARLKQILPQLEDKARRLPGWRAVHHHAMGEYQRLRGDLPRALEEFSAALELAPAGRHTSFSGAAAGLVATLRQLSRAGEASERGEVFIAEAERGDVGPQIHVLYEAVAMAHALSGRAARATELAELAIAVLREAGMTGAVLGGAYESAARVAFELGDEARFRELAERCAAEYAVQRSPILAARYKALLKLARDDFEPAHGAELTTQDTRRTLDLMLTECPGPAERAERALQAIVEQLGCEGGLLYAMKLTGPELVAQVGVPAPPAELDAQVAQYLAAEIEGSDDVTLTVADMADAASQTQNPGGFTMPDGGCYYPSLLAHEGPSGLEITGLVALRHRDARRARVVPEVAAIVSRALREAGDVPTVLAAS